MFVGVPGSGKTATARHIALVLQGEGYDILSIKNINDIETYCDPRNPQVFVIDDVLGKFGLDVTMYNILKKYEDILTTPKMSKTKVLMTCRELVYRNEKLSTHFLSQEQNVVMLNSKDNVLNDNDKLKILARYQLGSDVLSLAEIKSSSNMFPLLCKLFSSKPNFKDYGSTFFISPVPCILEELDHMSTESKKCYASLVLLMVNQNKLSKDILDNITNAHGESNVNEKKNNILKACKVRKDMEGFRIIDALSEMEKTYTRRFDSEFTFIHDSMFEIVAFHFGRRFQGLILQYMSSDYIAHYIKLETFDSENIESEEKTCKDNEQIKKNTVENSVIDMCIKLQGSHHKALAERLYIDVENGEWYNVFGNEALKRPSVVRAFIEVMAEKPYPKLKSLLFSELKHTANLRHCVNQVDRFHVSGGTERMINGMLINERFSRYYETSIRAISWVIYQGHNQLLQYIIARTIQENSNSYDLFRNSYNECKEHYPDEIKRGTNKGSEFIPDNALPDEQENDTDNVSKSSGDDCMSGEQDNDILGMFNCCLLCFGYCVTSDTNINSINSNDDGIVVVGRNMESEIDSYIEPVIVEQNRLLCLGCYSGDIATVTTLLKHVNKHAMNITESCHRRSYLVMNPLSIACSLGYLEITKTLINIKANINYKTDIFTPLIGACENGHISVVKLLIDTGADVNAVCTNKTPLTVACRQGYSDIVSTLIKGNASVNLYDGMDTPLTAACSEGHLHIVKTLIEAGAAVNHNINNCTPLTKVCYNGHLDVVQFLIEAGADMNLNDSEWTPLTSACYKGHLDIAEKLIEAGADVNLDDSKCTPLTIACYIGHLDVVQLLIEAGADVNLKDGKRTPLTSACYNGHLDVVQQLIEADANVNLNDGERTPLTLACEFGHLDVVKKLIKAGADVNFNDNESTPLTRACYNGHLDVVELLIEAGADVNLKDRKCTPLTKACFKGNLDIVHKLIEAGADVNLKDGKRTPLTVACYNGHLYVVQKLIETGADVNLNDGVFTPLSKALQNGHKDIVQKLKEAGADVNLYEGKYSLFTVACVF